MSQTIDNPTRVAIVAWSGMDLTDFTAPAEVFSHARNGSRQRLCAVTIASETEMTATNQGVSVGRDIDTDALIAQLPTIDVLVIPGGGSITADSIPSTPGMERVLDAFTRLPARAKDNPRVLMSICAGAFWLVRMGLLAGRVATSHYASLPELKKLADRHGQGTTVVRQHYVDSGVDEKTNLQIIMGGGITSGFDSTLYLLEQKFGGEVAVRAASILDYSWRKEMTPFGFVA